MIKVFISYSHDSDEHREWVLGLSERLRQDGIETILDRYVKNGSPPEGWSRWMSNSLDEATHVLCICTETYYRRFYGHEVPDKGKGVDWEGTMIAQELYDAYSVSKKFIPVLRSSTDELHIPKPLRPRTHYVLNTEANYQVLYDDLLGRGGVEPRPVGSLKAAAVTPVPPHTFQFGKNVDSDEPEFRTKSTSNDKPSHRKKSSAHKKTESSPATESTEVKKYAQTHVSKDDATANLDYLGRQNLVNALTDILTAKENFHHQTIGLLGDWGSGKSTFVNLLKSSLKKQTQTHFLFAEFNAWEYEHTDHMQAGIAREAMKGLITDLGWWKKMCLAFQLAKAENPWKVKLLLTSTIVLMTTSIIVGSYQLENPTEITFVLSGIVGSGAALILLKLFHSMQQLLKGPLVKEWKSYLTLPDYDRYLGTIPTMKQQINALCQLRLNIGKPVAEQKRLLYVVDDLDRCSHIGVVKTLEAVRLVMGIPQVIVIIAIDQRIALASLALHYKDLAGYHEQHNPGMIARDYLGKVIQLPVQLHAADADTITSFIESVLLNDSNIDSSTQESQRNTPKLDSDSDVKLELNESTKLDNPEKSITKIVEKIEYQLSFNEKQIFKERIKKFNISNPRQIKRLYNSFNLLRHLLGSEQANDHMLVLIWLEYLNSCSSDERKSIHENRHEFLDEQLKNEDYYKKIEQQVKPFVLPAWDQVT